jgi:hypothetical protein
LHFTVESAIRAGSTSTAGSDWVFPWRSKAPVFTAVQRCLKALSIDPTRPLHRFRDTGIDRWERAGVPVEVRLRFAGHTMAVYADHYDAGADAAKIEPMMRASG